jgi:hypothetical protein
MPQHAAYEKPIDADNMAPASSKLTYLSPGKALLLPGAFIAALLALGLALRSQPVVSQSMVGAAAALLLWAVALFATAQRSGRTLQVEVKLFKHHWVQVCTQVVIYTYWAWFIPEIREYGALVLAQLLFAYAFHMLLTWSRRDHYGLGFGPVPICLSFNLFILFKPDWFYWQFGIVALAFLAKEMIRWQKDGRSAHIFNPSSFGLVVFSAALILTGTTDRTLGVEIASALAQLPHVHWVLFLVSIPVQLLFGVTTMTLAAGLTTYLFGVMWFGATGTYYFLDAYIPVAVFVGMLLLITDPATAPRSESGRIVFGVLYGLGIIAAFALLRMADLPAFYDKLLPVPILNLMVRVIDRAAGNGAFRVVDFSRFGPTLSSAQRRATIVGIWAVAFTSLALVKGVGDEHPGQWLPFWQETCEAGSDRACDHLATLEQNLCLADSAWACNELGVLLAKLDYPESEIGGALDRSCSLGFSTACSNLGQLTSGSTAFATSRPLAPDLPLILRGNKRPIAERDPGVLYALACERGFAGTCGDA